MAFELKIKKQLGLPESNRLKYEPLLPSSGEIGRIISAFSNTEGAVLVMGMLSKNNKISVTGLSADFQVNVVLGNTLAKLSPQPSIEHGFIEHNGKQLFAIKVEKSNHPIAYNQIHYSFKAKKIHKVNFSAENNQKIGESIMSNEIHLDQILKYLIDNPGLINVNKHTVRETILNNQVSLSEAEQMIAKLRNTDYVRSIGDRYIGVSLNTKPYLDKGGFSHSIIDQSDTNMSKNIFISYQWNHKSSAIKLYDFLKFNGFAPTMDDHELSYKDKISIFMESIRASDYAVLIISDEYLKSENCMTEVLHVLDDRNSNDKILPIRHEDVKIFKPIDRMKYVEFWKEQVEDREKMLAGIDPTSAIAEFTKLKKAKRIYQDIGDFLANIADMLTSTIEEQEKTSYKSIVNYIQRK
jgi:hypothetical protein